MAHDSEGSPTAAPGELPASFATWRLNLRGESIRSAQDVGRIRSLTVVRLMRRGVNTAYADVPSAASLKNPPLGGDPWIAAADPFGRYVGMVSVYGAHTVRLDDARCWQPLTAFPRRTNVVLTRDMNIQEAAKIFEAIKGEALSVVEMSAESTTVDLLSEAHVLRRYT